MGDPLDKPPQHLVLKHQLYIELVNSGFVEMDLHWRNDHSMVGAICIHVQQ